MRCWTAPTAWIAVLGIIAFAVVRSVAAEKEDRDVGPARGSEHEKPKRITLPATVIADR